MAVSRAQFAGTHLENAAGWLLEIEAMFVGGWTIKRVPKVRIEKAAAAHQQATEPAQKRGRRASVTPQYSVDRHVRIGEPRAAPRAGGSTRHHHFEQRTILASRKGTTSVAGSRSGYIEGYNVASGIIATDVRATNEAKYIEGGTSTEAERVVYTTATNGEDYDQRQQFWALANENAHFVGDHTITVTTRGVEEAWDRAARDATMPEALRQTLAEAKAAADGCARKIVNDAGVVKRWLKKRNLSFPAELRPHLNLETPHNSRIGYSIIGQFPHDMSRAGMRRSLDQLVGEFTARKIPCQAVIHEPTAKNSKKNWHFHLIYYAGPTERLPNGRWSFEREGKRDKWGTMKSVPLKRMGRDEEVAAADWVPNLKKRWSEIVNAQAINEGILTRFTNETNQQRGLPKAQTRYTPGRQALHKQGFFTQGDVADNIASWTDWRRRKRMHLTNMMAGVRLTIEGVRRGAHSADLDAAQRNAIYDEVRRGDAMLGEADALADIAAHAMTLRQMITSGPKDVADHYSGVMETLSAKKPTPSRLEKRLFAQKVCDVAHSYFAEHQPVLDRLARIEDAAFVEFRAVVATANSSIDRLERRLYRIIATKDVQTSPIPAQPLDGGSGARRAIGAARAPRLEVPSVSSSVLHRARPQVIPPSQLLREGPVSEKAKPNIDPISVDLATLRREMLARAARLRRMNTARWQDTRPPEGEMASPSAAPIEIVRKSGRLAAQLGGGQGR